MIEIIGKCIACGKRFTVTPRLAAEADQADCLISPCCGFPSTVVKAANKSTRRSAPSANAEQKPLGITRKNIIDANERIPDTLVRCQNCGTDYSAIRADCPHCHVFRETADG